MSLISQFDPVFRAIGRAYDAHADRPAGLICKRGAYEGCPVLKLQRPQWTNDSMRRVPNETGIFFSVWLDATSVRKGRVLYNVHALKLRQLRGHTLTSNAFASAFRRAFEPLSDAWPNVSVDFGPQALMQGWIPLAPTIERDVLAQLDRFASVAELIDGLLADRAAAG